MTAKRGAYSKVKCLGCRRRKIRCVLPENHTIEPTGNPLPFEEACKRCQQNNLDCILDRTSLGKRAVPSNGHQHASQPLDESIPVASNSTLDVQHYFLSNPSVFSPQQSRPGSREMFEAVTSPVHLFSSLLSCEPAFASELGSPPCSSASVDSILTIVDEKLSAQLDGYLACARLHLPHIPNLPLLRHNTDRHGPATPFLLALLYATALDQPSARLSRLDHLRLPLHAYLFQHGQAMLYCLPKHRHAILALEIMAAYHPTLLVSTPCAAVSAVKSELYLGLAIGLARDLHLDQAPLVLCRQESEYERNLGDSLQWFSLVLASVSLASRHQRHQRHQGSDIACPRSVEAVLELLKSGSGLTPAIYFLLHRVACGLRENEAIGEIVENAHDLPRLNALIHTHQEEDDETGRTMHELIMPSHPHAALILHLCKCEVHLRHITVVGSAMFYAIVSGKRTDRSEEATASEAARVSQHLIHHIKASSAPQPQHDPIASFLEDVGNSRYDELERILTNFIHSCDLQLDGAMFCPPPLPTAAQILFCCKEIVENNAARLTGWGALHSRVDVSLILFQECARRLEAQAMVAHTKGGLLKASQRLIQTLHHIVTAWKAEVAHGGWRASDETSPSRSILLDSVLDRDLLADWSNWPQLAEINWSDYGLGM